MANGKILASVSGHSITEEDVARFIAAMGERGAAYNTPEGQKLVLEELIAQKLFLADAKKSLLEYEDGFKKRLADIKDRLLVDYAMEKLLGKITVNDADVKKYYDEHESEMKSGESVSASHILVDDETVAIELLEKIRSGEMTFEDAARAHSSCPSKENGGSLGTFGRGQMVPEFDTACFEMEVGELRGPVKTQFGYHLIRLDGKNASETVPFDAVKEEIRRRLIAEKQQATYRSRVNQLAILFPVDRY